MIKEAIHQEDVTRINIYVLNITALKHMKQTLTDLKGEVDLNNTVDQMDLTYLYRTFHQREKNMYSSQYMFYEVSVTLIPMPDRDTTEKTTDRYP